MQFVDTHCHIQSVGLTEGERSTRELWAKAPGLTGDDVVAHAVADDVTTMICVGCDIADSELAIDFVRERTGCYASIGIHPHEAALNVDRIEEFAALATQSKVVAIGECGLDYFYEHSPREQQIVVLKAQLDIAVQAGLPVIFHVREAFADFWPIFDAYAGKIRGVLHSFTDSQTNLDEAVKRGLYIGVNGIATFAKEPKQLSVYQSIPDDHLLLETDAPFLTPVPFRGKINEPKQIRTVADFLSQLRDQDLTQVAEVTTRNAKALFDL